MKFYRELFDLFSDHPTEMLSGLVSAIVILIVATIIYFVYERTFHKLFLKIAIKFNKKLPIIFIEAFHKPVKLFVLFFGIYLSISHFISVPLITTDLVSAQFAFDKVMRIIVIILATWGISNAASRLILDLEYLNKSLARDINSSATGFLSKFIKIVIIAFGTVIIISELGYDVNGLIAGLGLGGLTVALAAKDTASNFFGGLVILFDKPFEVSDWIETSDVEGVVEEISFRSTRIRNFSDALVVVPNSTLSNQTITNWSKMNKRKIELTLQLSFESSAGQIADMVREIRKHLEENNEIHNDSMLVSFKEISAGSFHIFVYCFTVTTVWKDYLGVREALNLKLMEIADAHHAQLAMPVIGIYPKEPRDLGKTIS